MTADQLAQEGIELYKGGDYAGAAAVLKRAHEMEPSSTAYRFALAQALRKAGNCAEAVPHYKALIESTLEPDMARDIHSAMEACPGAVDKPEPPPPVPPPPPPPPAVASDSISRSNALLMVGAGASVTAGVLFFVSSTFDRGDADSARSNDDFERISGRANWMLAASVVTIGAGAALAALAVVRHKRSSQRETALAISSPAGGGVSVVLGRSF